MQDFINFYNTLDVDWPILGFMMLMSMGAAIFHTVIIGQLWNINIKPGWLFFALNPALIGLSALYERKLGALVFGIVFISVFVFAILGIVISAIRDGAESAKEQNNYRQKMGKPPLPWWKKLLISISGLAFFGFILSLGAPVFIIIVFIILPFLSSIFFPSNSKRFYKLQRTLPTANIRSVAMGLAEISGNTKTIKPMISRIGSKNCIGYLYTIERVSTDDEGKNSYSMEFSETICNPFFVEDKTGKIKVLSDEIEFIDFEIDEQYQSSMKRYTQYLLKENMEVLLIGKAGLEDNNQVVFKKEEIKNVFGIAPVESVNNHNELRPILQSAGYFIYFWVMLIALILLTPIHLKNNTLEFGKINWGKPFQNSKPVNSIDDFYDNIYEQKQETETEEGQAEGVEATAEPHENAVIDTTSLINNN